MFCALPFPIPSGCGLPVNSTEGKECFDSSTLGVFLPSGRASGMLKAVQSRHKIDVVVFWKATMLVCWEEQSDTRAAKAESWVPAAGKTTTSFWYLLFQEDASSLCTKTWTTRAVGPCYSGRCHAISAGHDFQLHFRRALPQSSHLVVPKHILAGGKLLCL